MAAWIGAVVAGIADFATSVKFLAQRDEMRKAQGEARDLANREIDDAKKQFDVDMELKNEELGLSKKRLRMDKKSAKFEESQLLQQEEDIKNELRGGKLFAGAKKSFTGIPESLAHKESLLNRF